MTLLCSSAAAKCSTARLMPSSRPANSSKSLSSISYLPVCLVELLGTSAIRTRANPAFCLDASLQHTGGAFQ